MRRAVPLVPLLFLFLAAACGGDEKAEPTPTAATPTAAATPSPEAAAETLAFIRDGDVWLMNADGSN